MSDTTITTTKTNIEPMNNLREMAKIAANSKKYGEYDEHTILNIMYSARDLGISPFKALNGGFYIVKGKICMSTALMADRIRAAGHSIKIPEWDSEKCVVIGIRADNGDSVRFEYSHKDAQLAGLTSETWRKYPKNMLYNRAMSTLARVLFPDVIGNCYSEDEKEDIIKNNPEPIKIEIPAEKVEEIVQDSFLNPWDVLVDMINKDGLSFNKLEDYTDTIVKSKGVPVLKICESAIKPEIYPRFKEQYIKYLQLEEDRPGW